MLDLSLFKIPAMAPSLLASLFQGLASFAVLFLVIMYLQGPRGLTPIHAVAAAGARLRARLWRRAVRAGGWPTRSGR